MYDFENQIFSMEKRGFVLVDLDIIRDNMRNMKRHINDNTKMIAVIKTNAYGHGCVPIAKALEKEEYMFGFAVATYNEAHTLRVAGINKPILILGYVFPEEYELLINENIRPAVFRYDQIQELAAAAQKVGKTVNVHIKVDTGMGRIGITPDEEGLAFVNKLSKLPNVNIEGIFTHFALADVADKTHANGQFKSFMEFVENIKNRLGIEIAVKHCSNSAAIIEMPKANLDVVRAGITMYGLQPSDAVDMSIVELKPALSWISHIVYIKTIHAGQSISYGATYVADSDRRVATIPTGYGDGYPRSLSNKGYVLINGHKASILGRVCMDQFMVDITDIPDVKEGDLVTLIGKNGKMEITSNRLGELSERFNYELICDINPRVPRFYVQNGKYITEENVK